MLTPQTSRLAIIRPGLDHQKELMEFLLSNQIIDSPSFSQPNLHWINTEKESLKIQTVREVLSQVSYAAYGSGKQWYFLLHADLATLPAQNALLKLVEEPPAGTALILTATNTEKLLPTLLSRCNQILLSKTQPSTPNQEEQKTIDLEIFIQFLSSPQQFSYADIIDMVEPYKDRSQAQDLLFLLLSQIIQKKLHINELKTPQELLRTSQLLEKNINVKLALENCFFQIKKSSPL